MFPEFNMLLTHVPVHPCILEHQVRWNVHGHLHQHLVDDSRYFNASVEQLSYTPVHIEDIKAKMQDRF
jgi:calcineurin-like phosphoesterase family protein